MPVAIALFLASVGGAAAGLFALAAVGSPDQVPAAGQMERVAYHSMSLQVVLAGLVAAGLAAAAVSRERERGTWDLLAVGPLATADLLAAKLAAVVAYVGLFAAAALPLYVAVFEHAGLGLKPLAIAEVLTLATAAGVGALGLLLSALCSRTAIAVLGSTALVIAAFLDLVLAGLVPPPGTGLPQTRAQLLAGLSGQDVTGVPTDGAGQPLRPRRERVHLARLANPLYALHKAVTDPVPAVDPGGVPVVRVLRSLVPGDTTWSSRGPRLRPWHYAVGVTSASSVLLLAATTRAANSGRRLRRRRRRPRVGSRRGGSGGSGGGGEPDGRTGMVA